MTHRAAIQTGAAHPEVCFYLSVFRWCKDINTKKRNCLNTEKLSLQIFLVQLSAAAYSNQLSFRRSHLDRSSPLQASLHLLSSPPSRESHRPGETGRTGSGNASASVSKPQHTSSRRCLLAICSTVYVKAFPWFRYDCS